jgi:hypothetical protein
MLFSKASPQEFIIPGNLFLPSYWFPSELMIVPRAEVQPLVNCIPGNIHQGFDSRYEAERAYVVAFALGALRILPPRRNAGQRPLASAIPTPEALMIAFASASDDFLGAEWHVVFKGKRPGIYPAW